MNLKKNHKILLSIVIYILTTLCLIFIEHHFYHSVFCLDRAILYLLGQVFVICNILFDYKKIWKFMFKYRYIIGICVFAIMVLLGYSTSSIGQYNYAIQPDNTSTYNTPVWGRIRGIRSDEFIAGTPALLSQERVGTFSTTNDEIMATAGSVLLFPKLATWNISILSSPNLIGFLFLDEVRGFSFCSLLNYFLAFFGVFEMLLMLTNAKDDEEENLFKNKKFLSFIGTLLLVCSPVILWWNCQTFFAYGSLCIVFFDRLLRAKKIKHKILFAILLGIFGSCFVGISYPAWQVPYGYMYLGLALWTLIKDWKESNKKNLLYLIISLIVVVIILLPAFMGSRTELELMNNTVYPGERISYGGDGWKFFFLWFSSSIYGVSNVGNPCELSQFISLFPIPFLMALYEIVKHWKDKKKDIYLILLVLVHIGLSIWNFIPIGVLAKISMLYMSTTLRSQIVIGIINILIMIRLLEKYSSDKVKPRRFVIACVISFVTVALAAYINTQLLPGYLSTIKLVGLSILFFFLIALLILNNKRFNSILLVALGGISLFCLATIIPIQKGLSVIHDKPLAKEIQKINKKEEDSIWISANTDIHMANFILANDSKVINSVNYYPNLKLWHKLDKNKEYEDIYNRYAHIIINIGNDEKTTFQLVQGDNFIINTNADDICKLDIDYIASTDNDLEKYSMSNSVIKKIYDKDGSCIYKLSCNN